MSLFQVILTLKFKLLKSISNFHVSHGRIKYKEIKKNLSVPCWCIQCYEETLHLLPGSQDIR